MSLGAWRPLPQRSSHEICYRCSTIEADAALYSLAFDTSTLKPYWLFEGHICRECSRNPSLGVDNVLRITVDYLTK